MSRRSIGMIAGAVLFAAAVVAIKVGGMFGTIVIVTVFFVLVAGIVVDTVQTLRGRDS